MPVCVECHREVGFSQRVSGRCAECRAAASRPAPDLSADEEAISRVVLTTETHGSWETLERIDVITAECAFGMNIFKDLFASARDIFGGRSKAVQSTMRDARKTALHELRREAHAVGANAVVGVDLDYVELSRTGNMVMLVASGTAVRARFP